MLGPHEKKKLLKMEEKLGITGREHDDIHGRIINVLDCVLNNYTYLTTTEEQQRLQKQYDHEEGYDKGVDPR